MRAHVVCCTDIPAGIIGATVSIDYTDSMWDGLSKTVVFKGACTRDIVNAGNVVTIPAEVVSSPRVYLMMGIYGVDSDNKIVIPTLWANLKLVSEAADPSGDPAADPNLPVWVQLQDDVEKLGQEVEQLKQTGGGTAALPSVNPSDNGKVMTVVDGKWVPADLPKYDGTYEIIPSATADQILTTAQTFVDANIKISKIPYSEVLNNSGGTTVNIGG